MLLKTFAIKGACSDRSCRLLNSATEGSRQPALLPTFLLVQVRRAAGHPPATGDGDCSHTSPV